jgi:peptidoglycan/xylan/chitin deacetylase (PgdA/CDA1 family)
MSGLTLTTSWDDGTPEDVELAELLNRHGYLATFYATTGPGGSRTIDDRGLARLVELGHELGNHGRTHRRFVELSPEEIRRDIAWGEEEIGRFGPPGPVVAPPRGAVNRGVIEILNEQGFTVRLAPILGGRRARPGTMSPTAQVYPHSARVTYLHLLRRRTLPAIRFLRAWSRSRSMRQRLLAIAGEAAGSETSIHVWGHSEEIDRLGMWRDLELFLEAARERGFAASTNGDLVRAGYGTR